MWWVYFLVLSISLGKDTFMDFTTPTKVNVAAWLEHGRPSDYVILKEGLQHFENPRSIDISQLDFDLLTISRIVFPNGSKDIDGKQNLFRLMVEKLEQL